MLDIRGHYDIVIVICVHHLADICDEEPFQEFGNIPENKHTCKLKSNGILNFHLSCDFCRNDQGIYAIVELASLDLLVCC